MALRPIGHGGDLAKPQPGARVRAARDCFFAPRQSLIMSGPGENR